jgi:hypothetical protein
LRLGVVGKRFYFIFMSVEEKIEFADSIMECLKKHNSKDKVYALLSFLNQKDWQNAKDGVYLSIYGYASPI